MEEKAQREGKARKPSKAQWLFWFYSDLKHFHLY
jgi:hypothetical protein